MKSASTSAFSRAILTTKQLFRARNVNELGLAGAGEEYISRKKVIDLTSLEVAGFEVVESEKKLGTETDETNGGGPEKPKP